MRLSDEFLDRLRAANRIENVMSSYVTLKRNGRRYTCLCPFHSEKTPSCVVYTDTESFYCFGCHVGGDVISFVQRIENLSYIEAVRFLADKSGIQMPEDVKMGDDYTRKKQRMLEMNRKAARFFFDNLRGEKGLQARAYLKKRGLEIKTITKYGLGYACATWTTLRDYMLGEGYTEQELIDASLIARGKSGRTYDFFVNRVMFPFFNLQGKVIGFGGRTLDPEDKRKYLNTKETICYNKSKYLFSLNFAKEQATKTKRLLLCEGNMDVVSLNQAGFENSVATCGTAITDEQARIMSQYCDEVIICYDADTAGIKASEKAMRLFDEAGVTVKVLKIEGAKDPDEFIQKYGKERFSYLLNNSGGAVAFSLSRCESGLDMDSEIGKVEYLKRACDVLAGIPTEVERGFYISELAQKYGVPRNAVEQTVKSIMEKRGRSEKKKAWQTTVNSVSSSVDIKDGAMSASGKVTKAEEGIIAFLFANPDAVKYISPPAESFQTELLKRVYTSLCGKIERGESLSVSAFGGEFDPDEMSEITKVINMTKLIEINRETALDYVKVLKENAPADNAGAETIDLAEIARRKRSKVK